MKKTIYFFSGTGNCLAVSRDLAASLSGDVRLMPIAKQDSNEITHDRSDLIVIVYPLWLHHIPPMVEAFVKQLSPNGAFVSVVSTYSTSPYNSLFHMDDLLKERGSRISAGFSIPMPGKYLLLKDLTFSDEENERRLVEAKKKIKEVCKIVEERKFIGIEGKPVIDDIELINYHKNVYRVVEKFRVTEKCNHCGICLQVCPKNNLKFVNGSLVWSDQCEYCLACLHWCPQAAIENGEISPTAKRYHHPHVQVADIINQK